MKWYILNLHRHVLGITIPHFELKRLTKCWQDGKSYIVNRYIKYRCLKLAETIEKVGSIGIGREISQLCHISCSDAMTRGSQIRIGFTDLYFSWGCPLGVETHKESPKDKKDYSLTLLPVMRFICSVHPLKIVKIKMHANHYH